MKMVNDFKPIITHTMYNGTMRDSVEGYVVPINNETKIAYTLLVKWILELGEKPA